VGGGGGALFNAGSTVANPAQAPPPPRPPPPPPPPLFKAASSVATAALAHPWRQRHPHIIADGRRRQRHRPRGGVIGTGPALASPASAQRWRQRHRPSSGASGTGPALASTALVQRWRQRHRPSGGVSGTGLAVASAALAHPWRQRHWPSGGDKCTGPPVASTMGCGVGTCGCVFSRAHRLRLCGCQHGQPGRCGRGMHTSVVTSARHAPRVPGLREAATCMHLQPCIREAAPRIRAISTLRAAA
jgi:hypothetical protein